MDIKLKSYNRNKAWTIFAFIFCVFFHRDPMTGAMALESVSFISGTGMDVDDVLFYPSYKESADFQREFERKASDILYLIGDMKGEDYIKSGKTLKQWQLDNRIESLFYDKANRDESLYEKYDGFHGDAAARQRFEADFADEIDQIRQQLILDELRVFERAKEQLDRAEGFLLCHGRRLHHDESGKCSIVTG